MKIRLAFLVAGIGALMLLVAGLTTGFAQPAPGENAPTPPQTAPASALQKRLGEILEAIREPGMLREEFFAPEFLAKVPLRQLTTVFKTYSAYGAVKSALEVEPLSPYSVEIEAHTDKNKAYGIRLGVQPGADGKIIMLFVGQATDFLPTVADVLEAIKKLPGKTCVAVCELGGPAPKLTHALNENLSLGIGSAFKLYILGQLADDVNAGRRQLTDTVRLTSKCKSWPTGTLHTWPDGTPFTLSALAGFMISISDNTATDHLLMALGRERVEKQMVAMGNVSMAKFLPFLATHEMFRLKELGQRDRTLRYLAADEAGRRAIVDNEIAALEYKDFAGLDMAKPNSIEAIEWFASPLELCHAMDWLRQHTEPGMAAAPVRDLLGINRGVRFRQPAWRYAGYKGGSEVGVLNLTWLLQRANGSWVAASFSWNDSEKAVSDAKFVGLAQNLLSLLE